MFSNMRSNFGRLAEKLIEEGKQDSAIMVLDRCMELFPEEIIPFNNTLLTVISAYYHAGNMEKANHLAERLSNIMVEELDYYSSLDSEFKTGPRDINREIQTGLYVLQELYSITSKNNQSEVSKQIEQQFMKYMQQYR